MKRMCLFSCKVYLNSCTRGLYLMKNAQVFLIGQRAEWWNYFHVKLWVLSSDSHCNLLTCRSCGFAGAEKLHGARSWHQHSILLNLNFSDCLAWLAGDGSFPKKVSRVDNNKKEIRTLFKYCKKLGFFFFLIKSNSVNCYLLLMLEV